MLPRVEVSEGVCFDLHVTVDVEIEVMWLGGCLLVFSARAAGSSEIDSQIDTCKIYLETFYFSSAKNSHQTMLASGAGAPFVTVGCCFSSGGSVAPAIDARLAYDYSFHDRLSPPDPSLFESTSDSDLPVYSSPLLRS